MEIFLRKKRSSKVETLGGISLDNKRGVLFITTGNPENYFIGVDRPGENEYTNSVIAIDIDKKRTLEIPRN